MNISQLFARIENELLAKGFTFERKDFNRPWGGFFVIEEHQSKLFLDTYYPGESFEKLTKGGIISPKILVVAPDKRLSWQYHHRRSEVWKVIEGRVGVVRSKTDEEQPMRRYGIGRKVVLKRGERHRLVGLPNEYGVIAEIWQHSDAKNPSNEEDIVRLQDDFGR